jgi:hypothetical protein
MPCRGNGKPVRREGYHWSRRAGRALLRLADDIDTKRKEGDLLMSRQTATPLQHDTLNPAAQWARLLARRATEGEIELDPPYQRGDVWSEDQRLALLQSWLRGLPTGVVILADRTNPDWVRGNGDPYDTGQGYAAVIDGKQRITTAMHWFAGDLPAPASWFPEDYLTGTFEETPDGPYVRYSHLTAKGQRIVERRCSLLVSEVKGCSTLTEEAAFYLLVNKGGTPQSAADLANATKGARG